MNLFRYQTGNIVLPAAVFCGHFSSDLSILASAIPESRLGGLNAPVGLLVRFNQPTLLPHHAIDSLSNRILNVLGEFT